MKQYYKAIISSLLVVLFFLIAVFPFVFGVYILFSPGERNLICNPDETTKNIECLLMEPRILKTNVREFQLMGADVEIVRGGCLSIQDLLTYNEYRVALITSMGDIHITSYCGYSPEDFINEINEFVANPWNTPLVYQSEKRTHTVDILGGVGLITYGLFVIVRTYIYPSLSEKQRRSRQINLELREREQRKILSRLREITHSKNDNLD